MQKDLNSRCQETMVDYQNFIEESQHDLVQTMAELKQLSDELSKEQRITATLEQESKMNSAQLEKLGNDFA